MAHTRKDHTHPQHAVVLFDGVCNLCNGAVNFILDRDPGAYFRFASLQSDAAQALLAEHRLPPTYLKSIVVVEGGRIYTNSDAVLQIARQIKGWSWAYGLRWVPRFIRDPLYHWVARNRYRWFGTSDACRLPTPDLQARFLSTTV